MDEEEYRPRMGEGREGYGNFLVLRATGPQPITELLAAAIDPDDEDDDSLRLDWMGDSELLGEFGPDYGYYSVQLFMYGAGEARIEVIAIKPLEEWARTVTHDYPELDVEFSWRYLGGRRVVKGDEDGWERVLGVWAPLSEDGWAFRDARMRKGCRPLTARERRRASL